MCQHNLAPIVLFVYNRPWHTQQTIEALQRNELADESELIIYSDGPRDDKARESVRRVREYVKTINNGFKKITIIERDRNWGLADSIIDGVTEVVNEYGRVIVLEDDLVTSPFFLRYMNEALEFYRDNSSIMSISGYTLPPRYMKFPQNYYYDIYLNYRNSSWGWATWADRWELVDWDVQDYDQFIYNPEQQRLFNRGGDDLTPMLKSQMSGKIDSWAIRFSYAHFKERMYSVCPRYSYVSNIGCDGTGTHCGNEKKFKNDLLRAKPITNFINNIELDEDVMVEFRKFYRKKTLPIRIANLISRLLFKSGRMQ